MLCVQAPRQPKDCGVLAVRVDRAGDGGCTATLAAVHCSASMGIAYCVGSPRPAMQCVARDASGAAAGAVMTDAATRAAAEGGPGTGRAADHMDAQKQSVRVHTEFLRQTVRDARRPGICSFAKAVTWPPRPEQALCADD